MKNFFFWAIFIDGGASLTNAPARKYYAPQNILPNMNDFVKSNLSPISIHINQHLPSNKSVELLGPKEFKPSSESDICDNAERTVIEECSQFNPELDHKSLQDQYLPHEDVSIQLSPEYSGICTN
ncbi:hypothetical protein JTB14_035527 [Gonioctena quinquepunctata]|nr:hypothetical protein JTB14_035527 [Gonioctena quinquepunctata]